MYHAYRVHFVVYHMCRSQMGIPRLPGTFCSLPFVQESNGCTALARYFCGQPFEGVSYKCAVYIRSRSTFLSPLFLEVRGACTTYAWDVLWRSILVMEA